MKTLTHHYINGEFVKSHGTELFDLINPSTGELIGQVQLGDEQDTHAAIAAAQSAFKSYSKSSLEERAHYLEALAQAFAEDAEKHIEAMILEYGGNYRFVKASVARMSQSFLTARDSLGDLAFSKRMGAAEVQLVPLGVAGLITPWNASSSFVASKSAAALAAGCTVVAKPSEMSALQTDVLMQSLKKAKIPNGLINIVNGRGDIVGAELTRNPGVAKISFTGSTAVGKQIGRHATETMKRVTLELGGKSPFIVLDDANVDETIGFMISAGFMNNGQACIAGTRILIPESRLNKFLPKIKSAVESLKVGNPEDHDVAVGPLVSKKQYERVQSYIQKGIDEGAQILTGGLGHPSGLSSGNFVRPTVFVNVTNDMIIAREEIFGPVVSVISYKDEEEAIRIANDTNYGLAAYISSSNVEHAKKVAAEIQSGRVMINGFSDEPKAPFGGFKQSGIGREFGVYGIEAYMETRTVLL